MRNYILNAVIFSSLLSLVACEEKMTEDEIARIGIEPCRKPAKFISTIGFDPSKAAYSTSEQNIKGLTLIQLPASGDSIRKVYQDSSWSQYGYMSSITTDDNGNAYVAPIPFVNTLDNTLATIHTIYKVNNENGKMELFMELPKIDSIAGVNPYGILGLYYDCHGKKMYVSSVGGSTQEKENGSLYVIDIASKKIIDQLKGYDPLGLFVGGATGSKKLYFGHARTSDIYSIELSKDGTFKGKPTIELTLDGVGPRGMDKARRIRSDQYGNLLIYGIDFSYNLAAQSNKPESRYQFGYNREDKKWILMKIE